MRDDVAGQPLDRPRPDEVVTLSTWLDSRTSITGFLWEVLNIRGDVDSREGKYQTRAMIVYAVMLLGIQPEVVTDRPISR